MGLPLSDSGVEQRDRSSYHRRDIQGLRAVAVLLVVLYHAGGVVKQGFVGVDVFFVISGFVITGVLVRELESRGAVDLRRFYLRRMRRLLPALAVMLTVVLAASVLLAPAGIGHETALTGLFASLFSSNIYLYSLPTGYFATDQQLNPLLHTWTLGVEEQFYFLFPLILLVVWIRLLKLRRLGSPRMGATAAIGLVTAVSFLFSAIWWHGGQIGWLNNPSQLAYYSSLSRAWEFGLGAILALGGKLLRRTSAPVGTLLGIVGACAIGVSAFGLLGAGGAPPLVSIGLAVGGTVALIAGGFSATNPISGLLATRPFVFLGDRSYSLYLWHWPLIVFALALVPGSKIAAPVAALVSLVPALWSFRYVENPIRFKAHVRGRPRLALVAVCLTVPIGTALVLAGAQRYLPVGPATAFHADVVRGCDNGAPFGSPSRVACTWSVPNAQGLIVLIGDSNAGQFTEPVVAAGNRAGYRVDVATYSDCPFIQLRVVWRGASGCPEFDRDSLRNLVTARPNLVVIAARSDAYVDGSAAQLGLVNGLHLTSAPAEKARLWTTGVRGVADTLTDAGIPVIVVHPIPVLPVNTQACAVVLLLANSCRFSLARPAVDAQLENVTRAENDALAGLPDASTLDFETQLCSVTTCFSRPPGNRLIRYRDSDHLSVGGSEALTPAFYAAIIRHARS